MTIFQKSKLFILCILGLAISCSTNEIDPCEDSSCEDNCLSSADCEPGFTCQSLQDDGVFVCAIPPRKTVNNGVNPNNNNGHTSTNNQTTNNTTQTNNTTTQTNNGTSNNNTTSQTNNGTTTPPILPTSYTHFMLRDQTVGRGCSAISAAGPDPGSDIMWISMLNSNGQTLGHATTVSADDGIPENGHNNPNILNGSAPQTNGIGCTEAFNPTTVYSMGCGGTLIFRFNQNVTEGLHSVVVGEFGSTCGGSADDSYELFACSNPQDPTSCNISIGRNGEGITSFPISP